jgi:hypothetical protein
MLLPSSQGTAKHSAWVEISHRERSVKSFLYFIPFLMLAAVIYNLIARMLEEANRNLPAAEQFQILRRGRGYDIQGGLRQLRRKHRELYPTSRLAQWEGVCELLAAGYFLLFGIWVVFFPR